jgi:hypothetical protein
MGSSSASRAAAAAAFFAASFMTEEPSFLPRAYGSKAAPAAARVSAASALLDRGWGRPAQPHTGEDDKDHPSNNQKHCRTAEIRIDVGVSAIQRLAQSCRCSGQLTGGTARLTGKMTCGGSGPGAVRLTKRPRLSRGGVIGRSP